MRNCPANLQLSARKEPEGYDLDFIKKNNIPGGFNLAADSFRGFIDPGDTDFLLIKFLLNDP